MLLASFTLKVVGCQSLNIARQWSFPSLSTRIPLLVCLFGVVPTKHKNPILVLVEMVGISVARLV